MNKKFVWLAAAVVVIIAVAIWLGMSKTAAKSAVASGHPEWPPIMYKNGDVIDGAGPALVKQIFTDLGIAVTFPYEGEWDEVQAKARAGDVDVLVAAYKTDERLTYMDYSLPYTTDPIVLFVAKGKAFPFAKWDDLKSKHGVAMIGDSYGQEFDDYSAQNLNLVRVETTQQALDLVASGKADYFIYSLYAGAVMLKDTDQADKFENLPTQVAAEQFYITISKKSPLVKYMPQINAEIQKYQADGTTDALVAQYKSQQ